MVPKHVRTSKKKLQLRQAHSIKIISLYSMSSDCSVNIVLVIVKNTHRNVEVIVKCKLFNVRILTNGSMITKKVNYYRKAVSKESFLIYIRLTVSHLKYHRLHHRIASLDRSHIHSISCYY